MNEFEQKLSEIIRARCQGYLPSVGAERFLRDSAQELIGCLQKSNQEKIAQIKTQIALCNGFNRENRDKIFALLDSLYS